MPGAGHFYRQRGGQIVGFVALGTPAGNPALLKGGADGGHFGVQIVRHRCASGFVIRQTLMSPAAVTRFIVKYGDHVAGLTVANKLLQRMQAGILAGRTLNRVDAPDKIQRVDNKQMNGHRFSPFCSVK